MTAGLIVDANVVKCFYEKEVGHLDGSSISGDPAVVFDECIEPIYLDEASQIESEWREPVPTEWFDAWLSELLISDRVRYIQHSNARALLQRLKQKGFPWATRDKWYVRVAEAVVNTTQNTIIVTEDVDFIDPKSKRASHRSKLLQDCRGPVQKELKKNDIEVMSLYVLEGSIVGP